MVLPILDSGFLICGMAMDSKYGPMVLATRATGEQTRLKAMVVSFMQTATFMRENGLLTKLMEKELTHMPTEPITMETGWMISSMVGAWNRGQMEPSTKANM
jgi:hypothetical protein